MGGCSWASRAQDYQQCFNGIRWKDGANYVFHWTIPFRFVLPSPSMSHQQLSYQRKHLTVDNMTAATSEMKEICKNFDTNG